MCIYDQEQLRRFFHFHAMDKVAEGFAGAVLHDVAHLLATVVELPRHVVQYRMPVIYLEGLIW